MSREVIDGGAEPAGWAVAPGRLDEPSDLSDPADPPDPPDPLERPGPAPRAAASAWWTAVVLVVALVTGFLVGGWQARQAGRQAAQDATRLLVWAQTGADPGSAPDTVFVALARTVGGGVLLRELDTPFGTARFAPEEPVDAARTRPIRIRMTPDCAALSAWSTDWATAPRTGNAVVRDQAGAPLRRVRVDLVGDLVLADLVQVCAMQAQPVIRYSAATGTPDGTLSFEVSTANAGPVTVDLAVLDLIAGQAPGHFALTTSPALPVTLEPGQRQAVVAHLTYRCTAGQQVLPSADSILQASATDPATGTPVDEAGWDQTAAADAVRGAARSAGCPLTGP